MGLKIIHSADWHLGAAYGQLSDRQRETLVRAQKALPGQIADICRREGCQLALLSGDLLDGPVSREWVELLKEALADFQVPVMIAPGNHDYCCPGSPWVEEVWPENVHVFTGMMESVSLPALSCRVYGSGFQSMDCDALLDDFQAEGEERYCVAVLHGDPLRGDSPYNPVTKAQIRESGLDYLALGHVHKQGQLLAGETLCGWPGCPMGRGWDETGEKGVYIVTLEQEKEIRFVPVDSPRFYQLEVDIREDASAALAAVLPAGGNDDFYRVTLKGRGSADLSALQAQFSGFSNLALRSQVKPPVDVWADAGSDTLVGTYFGLLRERSEEDPAAALAAEISRKILAGEEVALP